MSMLQSIAFRRAVRNATRPCVQVLGAVSLAGLASWPAGALAQPAVNLDPTPTPTATATPRPAASPRPAVTPQATGVPRSPALPGLAPAASPQATATPASVGKPRPANLNVPPPSQLPRAATPPAAARPQATSVPAQAGSEPKPATVQVQRALQVVPVEATLERIRIVRSKTYSNSARPLPVSVGQTGPNPTQAIFQPGMTFEFSLRPPAGWGIISISNAQLTQVVGQSGTPIAALNQPGSPRAGSVGIPAVPDATPAQEKTVPWALPVSLEPGEAVIQLMAANPARGDTALQKFAAEFELVLGQATEVKVGDLRRRVGKPIELGPNPGELTLTITRIDAQALVMSATGLVDNIGEVVLTDANGQHYQPYAQDNHDVPGSKLPTRVWEYDYSELPAAPSLALTVYPVRQAARATVALDNLPLP